MILNINKWEVNTLLEMLSQHGSCINDIEHLKDKLRRLQTTLEPVKSTIEQVRTAE